MTLWQCFANLTLAFVSVLDIWSVHAFLFSVLESFTNSIFVLADSRAGINY